MNCAKAVRMYKFSQKGIQSFAKGELSMDWMPFLFTAGFWPGVNSDMFLRQRMFNSFHPTETIPDRRFSPNPSCPIQSSSDH